MNDMRTTCQFKNPDEMDVTISITMTLREWRLYRKQMEDKLAHLSHPTSNVGREVDDVLRKVDKTFLADVGADD